MAFRNREAKRRVATTRPVPTFNVFLTPDWQKVYTAAEAEADLSGHEYQFEFKGPGWYINRDPRDGTYFACLVTPQVISPVSSITGGRIWRSKWPTKAKFLFSYFGDALEALAIVNSVASAPVRVDERK